MIKIDEALFCDMVKFYGMTFQLPPLAARIYAYLIFDFERIGVSFDELVTVLSASKSSVSSNLNLLLGMNIIVDLNKIDERKRFFAMNEKYMNIRFSEIVSRLETELSIINRLKEVSSVDDEKSAKQFEVCSNLLENNISSIKKNIDQL